MKALNLTGMTFGKLSVLSRNHNKGRRRSYWNCLCSCGGETIVDGTSLKRGNTKSCGCLTAEKCGENFRTHGMSHCGGMSRQSSPEYSSWLSMKSRCYNAKHDAYKFYGGRGIEVCERWRSNFLDFLSDMGEKPTRDSTLDRINPELGYCPENCRWASIAEQKRNRRDCIFVSFQGRRVCLTEACEMAGVVYHRVWRRMKYKGFTFEQALAEVASSQTRQEGR